MGRFRAEAVIVRRIGDLTIVFYDEQSIYIKDKAHSWTVFHRWFAPRGSYGKGWKQFRNLLLRVKNIDFAHCYVLAYRWGIQSLSGVKEPEMAGRKIKEKLN